MEDGQTIVATARGVFTSAGGVLESKETGEKEIRCHGMLIVQMSEEKNETRVRPDLIEQRLQAFRSSF